MNTDFSEISTRYEHDSLIQKSVAAEAILIGLWGVLHVGWLPELPRGLQRI